MVLPWKFLLTTSAVISTAFGATGFASDCNPIESTNCGSDVALGTSAKLDFKSESPLFSVKGGSSRINYTSEGLKEWFEDHGDSPSIGSNFYIMYGKVEISCKIAPGQGMITDFFLQSDDLDEIDFEWLGAEETQIQTNYFGKGNLTYTGASRSTIYETKKNLTSEYHTYTIEWTETKLTWSFDGKVIATVVAADVSNDGAHDYPASPMKVFLGLWAGGDSTSSGTVSWAGGSTVMSGVPYIYNVEYLSVVDYSTGSSYSYSTDKKATISSNGGKINGNKDGSLPSEYTTPALNGATSTSSTKTSSTSTKTSSTTSNTSTKSTGSTSSTSTKTSSTTSNTSTKSTSSTSSTSTKASSTNSSTSTKASSTTSSSSNKSSSTASSSSNKSSSTASNKSSSTSTSKSESSTTKSSSSSSSTTTKAASTSTDFVHWNSTTVITTTHCSNNVCSKVTTTAPVLHTSTDIVRVNETVIATTTHCSNNVCSKVTTTSPVASTSTDIVRVNETVVVTTTHCSNNACSKVLSTSIGTSTSTSTKAVTTESTDVKSSTVVVHVSGSTKITSTKSYAAATVTVSGSSATLDATDKTSSLSSTTSSTEATTTKASTEATTTKASTEATTTKASTEATTSKTSTTTAKTTGKTISGSPTVVHGKTSAVSYVVSSSDDTSTTISTLYYSFTHSDYVTVHLSSTKTSSTKEKSATLDAAHSTSSIHSVYTSSTTTANSTIISINSARTLYIRETNVLMLGVVGLVFVLSVIII
ncbi:hypothetical protein DASC09_056750 [Saccharomycopsis crataegensis]|uniref:GH16 domain-containing protein n=1 Tax=Saccharomycopsis crataegensis TaxID=43959 RepID=A0AAV5QUF5_9ASCO|nr:hypothetical protein DASC09_056750 [Saccharomycopsis crataegensis]